MKKLLIALALFLLPTCALAQCNGVFPNNTACGNVSGASNTPRAIPLTSFPANAPGGSTGQIQYNAGSGLFGGFTASGDATINTTTGGVTVASISGVPVVTAGASTGDVLAYNGTSFTHTALASLFNTACSVAPSVCVAFFGYANPIWYGADPTNVSCSQTQINSAITASGLVKFSPGGTYNICGAILMKPNVRLTCNGSTLKLGNAVNPLAVIDAFTNTPNGAQVDHCTIDGNAANNTSQSTILIDASGISNFTASWNTLKNTTGGGINSSNNTNATFEHNLISGIITFGIAAFNTSPSISSYTQVHFNIMQGPALHLLQLSQIDATDASNNILLQGVAIGGPGNGAGGAMQVTIAGTAVTWVSGTNFAGVTLGEVLVANGGTEFPIASVNSSTSLTLIASGGSLTNVPAAIGGGDVLSLTNVSFSNITSNYVLGAVTGCVVLSQSGGAISSTESSVGNVISANRVRDCGNFGFALEAPSATGSPTVAQTILTGNYCDSPGRTGSAGSAPGCFQLFSAAGLMPGVTVVGNQSNDGFAVTGGFWLTGAGGNVATNVLIEANSTAGFVNAGNMSGYPTFASLPQIRGLNAHIIDASTCTTWGATVSAGGGSTPCDLWFNGTNWTTIGK